MSDFPDVREDCTTCIAYAEGLRGPCYLHSPERAEERRRNTSKAAKSKGNAELRKLKQEVRDIIADVKAGKRDRNDDRSHGRLPARPDAWNRRCASVRGRPRARIVAS